MEENKVNTTEVNEEIEITEEDTSSGTGLGVVLGAALTLAVMGGAKFVKKQYAKYKAKKELEAAEDTPALEVVNDSDDEELEK